MKLADSIMAGKTSDGSIKWQLCYDISARTWWMVSWQRGCLFLPPPSFFSTFPPSLTKCPRPHIYQINIWIFFFTLFTGAAFHLSHLCVFSPSVTRDRWCALHLKTVAAFSHSGWFPCTFLAKPSWIGSLTKFSFHSFSH